MTITSTISQMTPAQAEDYQLAMQKAAEAIVRAAGDRESA